MSFTVKDICAELVLPEQQLLKHRMYFGTHLRDAFKKATGNLPEKIDEHDFKVYSYPDTFRIEAEQLLKDYLLKYIPNKSQRTDSIAVVKANPISERNSVKKRKRIVSPVFRTSQSVK